LISAPSAISTTLGAFQLIRRTPYGGLSLIRGPHHPHVSQIAPRQSHFRPAGRVFKPSSREKKGLLFLKKRSKKTFLLGCVTSGSSRPACAEPNEKKFFGSFFQKRTLSF
jgi:hypothetical protein